MDYTIKSNVRGTRPMICVGIGCAINQAQWKINHTKATSVCCHDQNGKQVFRVEVNKSTGDHYYGWVWAWTWYNLWIGAREPIASTHQDHERIESKIYA
jgi:hypothetical protein